MDSLQDGQMEKLREWAVPGRYHKVAVLCWFTSTGKAMPKIVKYEDENQCRHTLDQIHVLKADEKRCTGFVVQRYNCSAVIDDRIQRFMLLYHPGENTWDMVIAR